VEDLRVNGGVVIAGWEMSEQFVRASGPGGQNVNKVESAVQLRFEAARSPHLTEAQKTRLRRLAGRRWTQDGAVLITADAHRSQARNREEARARLAGLIGRALERPKPRIAPRPARASPRRRAEAKTKRGQVKRLRRGPDETE